MQLLTASIRAQIEAMVLDAIKRLPPNILPTDPRFLEWLESLIRYRLREPLDPVEKPPVLGGIGIADKTVRWLDGDYLLMDSGWLAYDPTWLAAHPEELPLGIYLGDEEIDYLKLMSGGTDVPQGVPPKQFLIPSAKYQNERIDWPGMPPDITEAADSHTYESPIVLDSGDYPTSLSMVDPVHGETVDLLPSRYTGLMRLAVQAKIGAGLDPTELLWELGTENSYSASSGLVHDNEFNFWKIAIQSNGAFARKLNHQTEMEWIVNQLKLGMLGSYGDDDYTKFMGWLLMGLTVDGESSNVELLDSDDLSDVYDGRGPLKHGWHYNRNDPFECSIVTTKEEIVGADWWLECTLARIDIGFSAAGSPPSMQLDMEIEDEPAGIKPLQPLWIENRYGNRRLDGVVPPLGKTIPDEGEGVPVYCFYEKDGERIEVQWTKENTVAVDRISDFIQGCGFDCPETWHYEAAHYATLGGWSCGEVDYTDAKNTGWARRDDYSEMVFRDLKVGSGASLSHNCPTGDCGGGPSIYQEYPGYDQRSHITHYEYGNRERHSESYSKNDTSYSRFVVIPELDAEAVIIGKSAATTVTGTWFDDVTRGNRFLTQTVIWAQIREAPGAPNPWIAVGPFEKLNFTQAFALNPSVPISSVSGDLPAAEWTADIRAVTSTGELSLDTEFEGTDEEYYDAWADLYACSIPLPYESETVPTINSYTGNGIVYPEVPTEVGTDGRKMAGGFPQFDHEDLHATVFRWLGWV